MNGLYLHIPFCKQACSYCDFYFVTRQEQKQRFVDELIKEIQSKKDGVFAAEKIRTIYFGGGTPSLLSAKQIEAILKAIDEVFDLDVEEITLEMNPDDVSRSYLSDLKQAGITRASMGVQTFDEDLLRFMNRAHSRKEALKCLELLRNSELNSYTVDLIYGNPSQTIEMLEKDVETLLEFDPPHISAYSLTIEPRTRLGKQLELGRIIEPEDDLVAAHFDVVKNQLEKNEIHQYEVSNFAKKGFEAKHNSAYWTHQNYLGLGPGAHSFWWEEHQKSAKRWVNEANLSNYIEGSWNTKHELENLKLETLAEERLMLGLRTIDGISIQEFGKKYDFKFNEKQVQYLSIKQQENKLKFDEGRLRLTTRGLKISDSIILDIISLT